VVVLRALAERAGLQREVAVQRIGQKVRAQARDVRAGAETLEGDADVVLRVGRARVAAGARAAVRRPRRVAQRVLPLVERDRRGGLGQP
jgi:hypothetical protein